MNWKFGFVALGCSLCVLNPLDAGRQLDQTLHNPKTVADASSMLQQMHGEMRLIQEQLGSLKASQQLMSTENAIKLLTPKVRKLEVHLERLEKRLESVASSSELSHLKHDVSDLRLKVQVLANAPDVSVESALSALSPTLERMQKQVYFLYEAVKSQEAAQTQQLNARLDQVAQTTAEFKSSIQDQLAQAQSMSASVNLIRQALVQNHMMIKSMKVDMEGLKNEKLGAVYKQISDLKAQVNQEDLLAHMQMMKDQIQRLASVFKKSISSIDQSFQQAEKSIELGLQLEQKLGDLSSVQGRHFKGLKALYKKQEGLNQKVDVIHSVLDQTMVSKDRLDQLVNNFPVDKMMKAIRFLKGKTDLVSEQMQQLKQASIQNPQVELQKKQIHALYGKTQDLKKQTVDMQVKVVSCFDSLKQCLPLVERQKQQIGFLYEKTKSLVSQKDLEVFREVQRVEDRKIESLNRALEDQNQKLAQVAARVQQSVKQQDFNDLVQAVGLEKSKVDYLSLDLLSCQDKITQIAQSALELKNSFLSSKGVNETLLTQASQIAHLQKQTCYLHQQMRQVQPALQLEDLKQGLNELATKVQFLDQATSQQAMMEAKLHALTQQLEQKDEAINKLSKKVAFLMRTLKESATQTPATTGSDLSQLKAQIEEKIDQELKAVQNDRLAFETLIQRIAALEATLNLDEISESSD